MEKRKEALNRLQVRVANRRVFRERQLDWINCVLIASGRFDGRSKELAKVMRQIKTGKGE